MERTYVNELLARLGLVELDDDFAGEGGEGMLALNLRERVDRDDGRGGDGGGEEGVGTHYCKWSLKEGTVGVEPGKGMSTRWGTRRRNVRGCRSSTRPTRFIKAST